MTYQVAMQRASSSLIAADLLRFGCALGVVAYHFLTQFWHFPSNHQEVTLAGLSSPSAAWSNAARFGWVGVELFFVISGFMILRSLSGCNPRLFVHRRILRLAPAVWICAPVTALCLLNDGTTEDLAMRWVNAALFAPMGRLIDPSYWTLGIETAFYLVVAATLRATGGERGCDPLAAAFAASSLTYWLIKTVVWPTMPGMERMEQLLLLPHGCFFALGMMIARGQEGGRRREWLVIGGLAAIAGCLEINHHAAEQAMLLGRSSTATVPMLLVGIGVLVLATARHCQPLLQRTVGMAAARLLGLATYPLYLLHQEVGASLTALLGRAGVPTAVALGIAAAALVGMALVIARWIEPALRRRLAVALTYIATPRAAVAQAG